MCADHPVTAISWSTSHNTFYDLNKQSGILKIVQNDNGILSNENDDGPLLYSLLAVGCGEFSPIRIYSVNHNIFEREEISNVIFPLVQVIEAFPSPIAAPSQLLWNCFRGAERLLAWLYPCGSFGIHCAGLIQNASELIFKSGSTTGAPFLHWLSQNLLLVAGVAEGVQIISVSEQRVIKKIPVSQLTLPGAPMAISSTMYKDHIVDILTQPFLAHSSHLKGSTSKAAHIRIDFSSANKPPKVDFEMHHLGDISANMDLDVEDGEDGAQTASTTLLYSYFGIVRSPFSGSFIATLSGYICFFIIDLFSSLTKRFRTKQFYQ